MCQHEKVNANCILTSHPPQSPWICKKCGERGADVIGTLKENKYDVIVRNFTKQKEHTVR